MADDKSQIGKPDSEQININEEYEVAYWTDALGISKDELIKAVEAAGPWVKEVKEYLRRI